MPPSKSRERPPSGELSISFPNRSNQTIYARCLSPPLKLWKFMTGPDTGEPPSSSSLSDILKQGLEREGLGHEREDRARLALLQRPRFTIRARLGLLFLALFLVSAIMASAGWLILAGVEYRLRYVTATDVFANEIQQARRYEKNFFLYRSELSEGLQHLDAADLLLRQAAEDIGPVVGFAEMTTIRAHLSRYRHSIDE